MKTFRTEELGPAFAPLMEALEADGKVALTKGDIALTLKLGYEGTTEGSGDMMKSLEKIQNLVPEDKRDEFGNSLLKKIDEYRAARTPKKD